MSKRGASSAKAKPATVDRATVPVTAKPKSKGGRPSKYTPELVRSICERMAKGPPEGFLEVICRDEGMPSSATVRNWMEADPDVSSAIARAREIGFDQVAMDTLSIADDGKRDYDVGEEGGFVVNHDHIQRSKLRVDTRLKLLAKWDPKRYGDRVQLADNEGGKLEQPVTTINVIGVAAKHG